MKNYTINKANNTLESKIKECEQYVLFYKEYELKTLKLKQKLEQQKTELNNITHHKIHRGKTSNESTYNYDKTSKI